MTTCSGEGVGHPGFRKNPIPFGRMVTPMKHPIAVPRRSTEPWWGGGLMTWVVSGQSTPPTVFSLDFPPSTDPRVLILSSIVAG